LSSDIEQSGLLTSTSTGLPSKIDLNPVEQTKNAPSQILPSQSNLNQQRELVAEASSSSSEQIDSKVENSLFEPDSLEMKCTPTSSIEDENTDDHVHNSGLSLQQQLSMTSSSMSGVSLETVIEKEHADKNSDSDSFELVDKPDLIDDFIVVEEVGREAEEFDSEGRK
jgi:hypothetical protein